MELASWLARDLPRAAKDRLGLIDQLIELQSQQSRLKALEPDAERLLPTLWRGSATNFDRATTLIAWLFLVRKEGFTVEHDAIGLQRLRWRCVPSEDRADRTAA